MLRAEFGDPGTLRDQGMNQATDHADSRIVALVDAAIDAAIDSGQPFTVATIRAALPTVTSPGLIGARFRSAAMRKPRRMVQTGRWLPSDLPSTRCARVAEWVRA